MTGKSSAFNAIQLEVLWTRLISIVDEAAKAIVRTAFSTLSNEANDFACVLTDARGRSLAQNSGSIPSFIATLPATVKHFLNHFGAETMQPGDIFITNDPWRGTGHLPDVCIVQPIFRGDLWWDLLQQPHMSPTSVEGSALWRPAKYTRRACKFH